MAVMHNGLFDVGDDYEGQYGYTFMHSLRKDLDILITGAGSDEVPARH